VPGSVHPIAVSGGVDYLCGPQFGLAGHKHVCFGAPFPRLRAALSVPLIVPSLGFYPIGQTIFEGQDSILILCLYAASFLSLKSDRPLLAGFTLGLALFKFHLVLPTILLLLIYREIKAVLGFLYASGLVGVISTLIVGISGMAQFATNLIESNAALADPTNRERFALNPTAYSNIRGLIYWLIGPNSSDRTMLIIVAAASAGLLVAAGLWLRRIPTDLRFSFTIVITTLVSFHLYYHDVSMMLIPMFVAAEAALAGRSSQTVLGIALAVLMFSPLVSLFVPVQPGKSYDYSNRDGRSLPGVCACTATPDTNYGNRNNITAAQFAD
jgi:hypothetical protein